MDVPLLATSVFDKSHLCELIDNAQSISINSQTPFLYKSGLLSPFYINIKNVLSSPTSRREIFDALVSLVSNNIDIKSIDAVVGVPTGGIPFATEIASKLDLPLIYIPDKSKSHGPARKLEGILLSKQKRVVVVDEAIVSGNSIATSVDILQDFGFQVESIFTILDFNLNEIQSQAFNQLGVPRYSLLNLTEISNYINNSPTVPVEDKKSINNWLAAPQEWSAKKTTRQQGFSIVITGSASRELSPKLQLLSQQIGTEIAKANCILLTGACWGVTYYAAQGAKAAGGLVLGISPANSYKEQIEKHQWPDEYHDFIFYTGLGFKVKNVIGVRAADAIIVVCGGIGTLNEFTIAFDECKPIAVLSDTGGIAAYIMELAKLSTRSLETPIIFDSDPHSLITKLLDVLAIYNPKEVLK